jgi:hypothetical protein
MITRETTQDALADLLADPVGCVDERGTRVFGRWLGQDGRRGRVLVDRVGEGWSSQHVHLVGEIGPADSLRQHRTLATERLELFWAVASRRGIESSAGPASEDDCDEWQIHTV